MIEDSKKKTKVIFKILGGNVRDAYDKNGKADPYVRIGKLTSKEKIKWLIKTPVVSENLNPIWNYEVEEKLNLSKLTILKVEMYDRDLLSADELIGECDIDVSNLKKNDRPYETYTLFNKKNQDRTFGSVFISIEKVK